MAYLLTNVCSKHYWNRTFTVNIIVGCILFGDTVYIYGVYIHCVSKKNDNDVAHYNFNAHKPILVIFSTDVAE